MSPFKKIFFVVSLLMFFIIVCMLLFGCTSDENPVPTIINNSFSKAFLYVKGIVWKIDDNSSTELEKFATKLWMDRVKDNLTLSNTGQVLEIQIRSSSFIELPGAIEFCIKLLCKAKNSNIALKIKVKGKKNMTSIGATIDKMSSEIAQEILDRLKAEYGNANVSKGENIPVKPVYRKQNVEDLIPETQTNPDKPEKKMSQQPSKVEIENLIKTDTPTSNATNTTNTTNTNSSPTPPQPTPTTPAVPASPTVDLLAQPAATNATNTSNTATSPATSSTTNPPVTKNPTTNLLQQSLQSLNNITEQMVNTESNIGSQISSGVSSVTGTNPADAGNRYLRLATGN